MKISKYTFVFEGENKDYYIYNTLSNALLEIDKETFDLFEKLKKQEQPIITPEIIQDKEFFDLLKDKFFITENEKDDFLVLKSIMNNFRQGNEHISLTIAPTMDCNYKCYYCFEQNEKRYISSEVIDSIINYISAQKEAKSLNITWFGGEPLMAATQMKEFYDKFVPIWGDRKFESNIITNGFFVSEYTLSVLKEIKVSSMQISVDGEKERHNAVKFTDDCADTFEKTMQNIDLIARTAPEIHVTIRANLDKNNADEFPRLYRYIAEHYQGFPNIVIAPGFIQDRSCNCNDPQNSCLFHGKEISDYVLNLFHQKNIHTPFVKYPEPFINECNIRNPNTLAIDPDGYVYKCWEIVGNKKHTIGKINSEGGLEITNSTKHLRFLYGADPMDDKKCSVCRYLPICMGGCPLQRIENEFENKSNYNCTYLKGHLPDFLKIHLKLKGLQNTTVIK